MSQLDVRRLQKRINKIALYLSFWTLLWLAMAGGLIAVGILVGRSNDIGRLVELAPGNAMGSGDVQAVAGSINIGPASLFGATCIVQEYPGYWMFTCKIFGSLKWVAATTATSFVMADVIPAAMAPDNPVIVQMTCTRSADVLGAADTLNFTFGTGANKRGITMNPEQSGTNPDRDWEIQFLSFSYTKLK